MDFYGLYGYLADMYNIREFGVCHNNGSTWKIYCQDSHGNDHNLYVDVVSRELSSECARYRVVVDHLSPWVVGAILLS